MRQTLSGSARDRAVGALHIYICMYTYTYMARASYIYVRSSGDASALGGGAGTPRRERGLCEWFMSRRLALIIYNA